MKKFITLTVSILTVFSTATSVYAATGKIVDGRTLVPVRGAFEELGLNVRWDSLAQEALVADGKVTIHIPKGYDCIDVVSSDSFGLPVRTTIYLDVPQTIINDQFYIPLRAVSDVLGADISWNSETKVAHIRYNGLDSYVYCGNE